MTAARSNPASTAVNNAARAPAAVSSTLAGVSRMLVQGGVVEESAAVALVARAEKEKISFMEAFAANGRAVAVKAATHLAHAFDLPQIDLDCIDPERAPPEGMFERKRMAELRALPLFIRGSKLYLATDDPNAVGNLDYFTLKSGKKIELVVADAVQLSAYLTEPGGAKSALIDLDDAELEFALPDPSEPAPEEEVVIDTESEASPIVKMVKGVLLTAIRKGASDIHFEPFEKFYRVRLRIDGVLIQLSRQPVKYGPYIASRIKVISGMNIAEKRVPQDGRMRLPIGGGRAIDFRVSSCPTVDGEKIVMRILDPSQASLGIDALGYEAEQKAALLHAIQRPDGMVLVTGPTGSGKTVSLYTCLNILNTDDINISTAEDPAEIQLPGINQVSVNPAQGLTFSSALKAFLRQDPDVIMVGEIRDEETAEISCKAAQTGHLVLSTLHTNDAPKTVARLIEIGVKPFVVASSVILITAQRLIRRLCVHCKLDHRPTREVLLAAGMALADIEGMGSTWKPKTNNPAGCEHCTRGYKGRVGVYQVMPISEAIAAIIAANGTSVQIAEQATAEGVKDLRRSGLSKYRQGVTSLDEVLAATNL